MRKYRAKRAKNVPIAIISFYQTQTRTGILPLFRFCYLFVTHVYSSFLQNDRGMDPVHGLLVHGLFPRRMDEMEA